jgi:hypothetical protein
VEGHAKQSRTTREQPTVKRTNAKVCANDRLENAIGVPVSGTQAWEREQLR